MKKTIKNKLRVLITAGPTRERIDPIRFLSNNSTGKMGFEVARACVRKGMKVCLVSGPVSREAPKGAEVVFVTTAREMKQEVFRHINNYDCLVMSAAVSDFRPKEIKKQKIKKKESLTLKLVKNPDILEGLKNKKGLVRIGFALETRSAVKNALGKAKMKNLDLIVLNKKTKKEDPFGDGEKNYIFLDKKGKKKALKNKTKKQLALLLAGEIEKLWISKKALL